MRKLYIFCLLFISFCGRADAQALQANHLTTNGEVRKILKLGQTTYVAGSFSHIGYSAGNIVEVDKLTGLATNANAVAPNYYVRTAISDGSGGWYIGGEFTEVGGQARKYLARINADGTLHPWNPSPDYYVYDLTIDNGVLYVGGGFSNIAAVARRGIASFNISDGLITSFNPVVPGNVMSMIVSGTDLYFGGSFSTVNGVARTNAAMVNKTSGVLGAFAPNPNSSVRTMIEQDGVIYMGGGFGSAGGATRQMLAGVNKTTGVATSWNPGSNGTVYKLAADANNVYVAGLYTTVGGAARKNLAAISISTGLATAWAPNTTGTVYSILLNGSSIYVGLGGGSTIGGSYRSGLAEINISTGVATSFHPSIGGSAFAIAASATKVFAGGMFSTVNGESRSGLAAFDEVGNLLPFNPQIQGSVNDMIIHDNKLFIAGQFYQVDAQNRRALAAFDLSSGTLNSWNPQVMGGEVLSMALSAASNTMYIGGSFNRVGAVYISHLAALNISDGIAHAWDPGIDGMDGIKSVLVSNGRIFVAGDFYMVAGEVRQGLASFDETTRALDNWNPDIQGNVESMAIHGDHLYIGGSIYEAGGSPRENLAGISLLTGAVNTFSPSFDNQVNALAIANGKLYAGGYFSEVNGLPRGSIAAFDIVSGALDTWAPLSNGSVNSIYANTDQVFLGGQYLGVADGYRSLAVFGTPLLLPLRWLDFNVTSTHSSAMVSWSTDQESRAASFGIERGTDGYRFEKIGSVAALNRTGIHRYHFDDGDFGGLNAAKVYYRLAQYDTDGRMSYSKIISIRKSSPVNMVFYPNPAQDHSRLSFQLARSERVKLTIVNTAGITVKIISMNAQAGTNNVGLGLNRLASGTYLLKIMGSSFHEEIRFVK